MVKNLSILSIMLLIYNNVSALPLNDERIVINNGETIDSIIGDFENNSGNSSGGAIYNQQNAMIKSIDGNFINNEAELGGAIYNEGAILSVSGLFDGNLATSGGAIYNNNTISTINADFSNNSNAIYNVGQITKIWGDFKNNKNGAIYNTGIIGTITGDFIGNTAKNLGDISSVIYNSSEIINFVNSSFMNNYVEDTDYFWGGVIYSKALVNIKADSGYSIFSGNSVYSKWGRTWSETRDVNTAVYAKELQVESYNNGLVKFDNSVIVENHITLKSDETSEIVFNDNLLAIGGSYRVEDGSNVRLGKDAEMVLLTYKSEYSNLILDIEVDKENKTISNGIINVEGDVLGETDVIIDSKNPDVYEKAQTIFLKAPNDSSDTLSNFFVSRVIGSPYMWSSVRNYKGEEDGSTWYLVMSSIENVDWDGNVEDDENSEESNGDDEKNSPSVTPPTEGDSPDGGDKKEETPPSGNNENNNSQKPLNPIYAPEIGGYISIPRVAIEQNRSISDSVGKGLVSNYKCNGVYCYKFNKAKVNEEAWIDISYEKAEITSPQEIDTKIQGATLGFDFYRGVDDRVGVFGAIREGEYELSGKGKYYSNIATDITTDSYLGGLYYKHEDRNDWKILALAFIGKQDIDVSTKDSKVYASTDAIQYGASMEFYKKLYISQRIDLEPSLGIYYTGIDIDPISDNVGKTAEYDMLHYIEAELGLRFGYKFFVNNRENSIYVKPSVIQTFVNGGGVNVTNLSDDIKGCDNETLGRVEVGGDFSIIPHLSGYTSAGYTFGSDYTSYDIKAGLSYEF